MKCFSILFFIILAISSCSTTGERVCAYHVDVAQRANLKDFFSNYSFVRLETAKECLLATPQKIIVNNNIISVLDHDKIFFFDEQGKFLSKISHVGKGHGEYIAINDYALQDTLVYVLARAQKAIYTYGFHGDMIKKISLSDWYAHICFYGKDTLVLSSENANESGKNFLMYDISKNKVIAEYDDFNENENLLFDTFSPFVGFKNGLLVVHPFDYRIYRLTKDGMEDFCEFQFKTKENADFIKKGISYNELLEKTTNRSVVKYLGSLAYVGNQMYLTFDLFDTVGGMAPHICKIDADGRATNVRLFEKIDKRFPYLTNPVGWHEGSMVSFASASWILQKEKKYKLSKFNKLGLTKEDNGVIFFHKLRH